MSAVTRIDWTVADGNVWDGESDEYDMEASLDSLAEQINAALRGAYPQAAVTVTRENVSGGVRELRAQSDDEDGIVDFDTEEQIADVADRVWMTGDWYVRSVPV